MLQKRHTLLTLDGPANGLAVFGVYGSDTVSVNAFLFFYGDGAEEKVATSEELWRDWMVKTFPPPA